MTTDIDTSNLKRIESNQYTQAHTFADSEPLSEVEKRGVTQHQGSTQMSVKAAGESAFTEGPTFMKSHGQTIADHGAVDSHDIVQIADQKVSVGAAMNMGLLEKAGGEYRLTEQGKALVGDRAAKGKNPVQERVSLHDGNTEKAIRSLDYKTKGKFTSYLPDILNRHAAGREQDYQMVNQLAQDAGVKPEFMEGMLSEIAQASIDRACQYAGKKEGMAANDVFTLIKGCSAKVRGRFMTAATMGATAETLAIVRAIRRGDIR